MDQKVEPLFARGRSWAAFRSGEQAMIIGTEMITPPSTASGKTYEPRACFCLLYRDGTEDHVPLTDCIKQPGMGDPPYDLEFTPDGDGPYPFRTRDEVKEEILAAFTSVTFPSSFSGRSILRECVHSALWHLGYSHDRAEEIIGNFAKTGVLPTL